MEITIKGKAHSTKLCFRAFMLFENVVGHSYTGQTLSDEIMLLLCALWSAKSDADVDIDALTESLDGDPLQLTLWREELGRYFALQNAKMSKPEEQEGDPESKKKA